MGNVGLSVFTVALETLHFEASEEAHKKMNYDLSGRSKGGRFGSNDRIVIDDR